MDEQVLKPNQSILQQVTDVTRTLSELQCRIPPVSDKALVDLVNGIQVNRELVSYNKQRGILARIFDGLGGNSYQQRLLIDSNLVLGQQTLVAWVNELTDSLKISQVALTITQRSLLEAREAIRRQTHILENFSYSLDQLANRIGIRLDELESRINRLELRVTANTDFEQIVTAWQAGQTYSNLPWLVQVVLLCREVFSSSVVDYERKNPDNYYRDLLANKILATSKDLRESSFELTDLIDRTCRSIDKRDLAIVSSLLETRSVNYSRLVNMPHLFTLSTALEMTSFVDETIPKQPGRLALAICNAQISALYRTTDFQNIINQVIQETANDCLSIMTIGHK